MGFYLFDIELYVKDLELCVKDLELCVKDIELGKECTRLPINFQS